MRISIKAKNVNGGFGIPQMLVVTFLDNSSVGLLPSEEKTLWLTVNPEINEKDDGILDVVITENKIGYHLYEEASYDFDTQWERKNTCYSADTIKGLFPIHKIEEIFAGVGCSISNIEIIVTGECFTNAWEEKEMLIETGNGTYLFKDFLLCS